MEGCKSVLRSVKPFAIREEEGRGEEMEKFLVSTSLFTGKKVPLYCFETGTKDYYFGWDGEYYIAGFTSDFVDIPKYRLDDFKYLFQLERVLEE